MVRQPTERAPAGSRRSAAGRQPRPLPRPPAAARDGASLIRWLITFDTPPRYIEMP
jgi:hypothetical protein